MSKLYKGEKYTYTNIDNKVFYDGELTAKAKGVLCQMLSFPDGWNYSIAGLSKFFKDGRDSIRSAVQELEECGYLIRKQIYKDGKFDGYDYLIFANPENSKNADSPLTENPTTENPTTEIPMTEIPTQLNTKESITKKSITNSSDIYSADSVKRNKKFVKPTIEEIQAYIDERGNSIDAEYFYDYYESNGWMVGRTNMKDWKATIRRWERSDYGNQKPNGTVFGANGKGKGQTNTRDRDIPPPGFRFPDAPRAERDETS